MFLLPKGHTDEAWEPFENGAALDRKVLFPPLLKSVTARRFHETA